MKHAVAFPSVDENSAAKRNKFQAGVRAYAADYMYDFLTAGFAASSDVFKRAGELGVIVHCHRAMHAVFTRQQNHGIHMRVVAKWLRLTGGDHLHKGTVVGKLEGSRQETLGVIDLLRERQTQFDPERGVYFDQDFAGLKAVWPVASGGIHVLNIPDLYAIYGNDAFWLFGGGTHGHPEAVAREHAPTGSPPKRLPPAKHSMMQPRPAPNCVRRWNCGARSSSKWRIEKWCPHACADRSNKRQTRTEVFP